MQDKAKYSLFFLSSALLKMGSPFPLCLSSGNQHCVNDFKTPMLVPVWLVCLPLDSSKITLIKSRKILSAQDRKSKGTASVCQIDLKIPMTTCTLKFSQQYWVYWSRISRSRLYQQFLLNGDKCKAFHLNHNCIGFLGLKYAVLQTSAGCSLKIHLIILHLVQGHQNATADNVELLCIESVL